MANIKRIEGRTGVSFQITVTQGRDISGKQVLAMMERQEDGIYRCLRGLW